MRDAQDRVTAAEKELEAKKEALTVAGKTREEIELAKTAIDQAKARAEVYDSELQSALAHVEGIVSGWKSLDTTIRTTHVVNTVHTTNGSGPAGTTTTTNNSAAAAAALAKMQTSGVNSLTNAERQLLGLAPRTTPGALSWTPYADGGPVSGPGTPTSDSIPAMLSNGEYVIKAASVNKFGKNFLDAINAGRLPGFKLGGMLRDGGGSSKPSTPIKAGIPRKTAAASATAPRQSALEKALPIIMPYAQQMMDITGSITAGKEMGQALVSLVGGKATSADAMVLGLGALNFIPGGRAVSTGAKGVKAIGNVVKKFDHVDTILANQGRGYAPYTRIDGPGGIAAARANADERIRGLAGTYMGQYLGNAKSLYDYPEKMDAISRFFNLGDEFIPGGLEMYRIPSAGEVLGRLPTKVGDIYRPGKVTSAATSGDLQQLGQIFTDKTMATGGNQHLAQGIAQIFTRKPIPGIEDLTKFLSTKKLDIRSAKQSQFMKEYVLGPNTSYRVHNFTPGTRNTPASWTLEAFIEKFAKGGLVKPSYFARGGMVKPSYFAGGGMVKPSYYSNGGFAKGTDTVPAMLTPGEFVMNRNASRDFGPLLSAINSGGRNFATPVYPEISRTYPSSNIGGGLYSNNNVAEIGAPVDNSVYNYSLSVNVAGTNATPDQIANVVMRKLQGVESQRVRGQVVR